MDDLELDQKLISINQTMSEQIKQYEKYRIKKIKTRIKFKDQDYVMKIII